MKEEGEEEGGEGEKEEGEEERGEKEKGEKEEGEEERGEGEKLGTGYSFPIDNLRHTRWASWKTGACPLFLGRSARRVNPSKRSSSPISGIRFDARTSLIIGNMNLTGLAFHRRGRGEKCAEAAEGPPSGMSSLG